jgi:hypothetical protein
MLNNLKRKGVPVLAYLSDFTADSSLPCSFNVKYSEPLTEVTISLQFTFFIDGFDKEQVFTLVYGADNLVADKITLYHEADSFIPQERLHQISKQGKPQWKTLSLALKTPCPIRCPPCGTPILPHKSTCPTFNHCFVRLARAMELKIVIDYSVFRREERGTIDKIISSLEKYTACRTRTSEEHVQYTTGLAFECAVAVSEDPPPLYTDAPKQRFTKRPRQGKFSNTGGV